MEAQLTVDDYKPFLGDLAPHIASAFFQYHKENPEIFELFKKFASRVKTSGRKFYGAKAIMEKIRWEINIERSGDFKVNDHHTSCYVRLLILEDPSYADFFELRHNLRVVS